MEESEGYCVYVFLKIDLMIKIEKYHCGSGVILQFDLYSLIFEDFIVVDLSNLQILIKKELLMSF